MASCTLCVSLLDVNRSDIRFMTRDEAQSHAAQHLSHLKHFDDKTCSSMEKVFDPCFPNFGVTPVRKQNRIVVKKEGNISVKRQFLLKVCHAVFKGRISDASPRVTCRKCGLGIILYAKQQAGVHVGSALNHASAHLGLDLFQCLKCGRAFSNKTTLRSHLWRTHRLRSLSEYFTDRSSDFIDEITNSIQQCFTDADNGEPMDEIARLIRCFPVRKQKKKIVVKKEGRQTLLNVCHAVFKGRISKTSPRATCQKCGSEITLYGGKGSGLHFGNAINHASAHLGIDLFECRKCGRGFGNKRALSNHLRLTHGLRCQSEYVVDKSGDYVDEISDSIEQCFTGGINKGPSDERARMIRLKSEANVRSTTKGSKLAVERQLFCYHLIRQHPGERAIQCRLCPKKIGIKQISGYMAHRAMEHALMHLKKPVFRCKVCSNVHHSHASMKFHLESVHALPLMNNYDSLADEFHADLLDVLRKCYAEEPGK